MDKLAELNHGAKVVLGSAILLLIFSFFSWFEVEGTPIDVSMWTGVGVVAGLLLIALIVWQAVRLANINLEIGVGPAMVTAFLALLTLVFVFIRWIDNPYGDAGDRTIWAWIGLVLGIVMVVGAWFNMQLAGERFGDLQKLGSGGGGESSTPASTPSQTPPPPPPPSGDDTPGS
jgi:hypothetical protein